MSLIFQAVVIVWLHGLQLAFGGISNCWHCQTDRIQVDPLSPVSSCAQPAIGSSPPGWVNETCFYDSNSCWAMQTYSPDWPGGGSYTYRGCFDKMQLPSGLDNGLINSVGACRPATNRTFDGISYLVKACYCTGGSLCNGNLDPSPPKTSTTTKPQSPTQPVFTKYSPTGSQASASTNAATNPAATSAAIQPADATTTAPAGRMSTPVMVGIGAGAVAGIGLLCYAGYKISSRSAAKESLGGEEEGEEAAAEKTSL